MRSPQKYVVEVTPFQGVAAAAATAAEQHAKSAAPGVWHSPDFTTVNWHGELFTFTPYQRAIVAVLWEAMEKGVPFVGGQTLLEAAECESKRLAGIFADHPAWKRLVVPGPMCGGPAGTYRLAHGPAEPAGKAGGK